MSNKYAKVTEEQLKNLIKDVDYIVYGNTTICVMEMKFGFRLLGSSACMNDKDFDKAIGEKLAYQTAFDKLWQLEGYYRMKAEYYTCDHDGE